MKDETVFRTMLFDFYGELLTKKQKEYFDLHYNEDYSLAEIAEQNGVSRQGVWDIINRAEQSLREYEEKTGLIKRETARRGALSELREQLAAIVGMTEGPAHSTAKSALEKVAALTD